jgi:phosphoribosylformylglycinamidine synthase
MTLTRPLPCLILHANGTNRDHEAAQALEAAGAAPEIVHLNQLRQGEKRWSDYHLLLLPGGFSYGDALGAGKLLALDLKIYFADAVQAFIASGKPVIGICNGFQALVKSGLLPDMAKSGEKTTATLTFNEHGHFECRWVKLKPVSRACLWTRGLEELITCPVAHGEGRFMPGSSAVFESLKANDQIALMYALPDGAAANQTYPHNPNGSIADIAGICNPQGNVLGLMPHPEDHIAPFQHPLWTRGQSGQLGLPLFQNGVAYARQL